MSQRPKCKCGKNLPINYVKNGVTHYRRECFKCKEKRVTPDWALAGYQKLSHCELCGFESKYREQTTVVAHKQWYRTVCLNCAVEVTTLGFWPLGDLTADF